MNTVTNWGTAIISSFAAALALVFSFIPKLIGFLVILIVGWIVAALLEKGVTMLLRRVGFDRISERIGLARLEQRLNIRMDAASILGKIVFWFVFLIFLVPACNALQLDSVSQLLALIVGYIPNVFVAIVVLLLGMLLATFVADVVYRALSHSKTSNPNVLANVARYVIIGFAVLVALEQLQIATALITILFTAVVGSVALACALSFGLGGRDAAKQLLERSVGTISAMSQNAPTPTTQLDMRQRFNQVPPLGGKERYNPIAPARPPEQTRTGQGYNDQTNIDPRIRG
jgi:Conserved TM helix